MKALSYWASRHVFATRFLLVLIGILKGCIGTIIGYGLLQNVPSEILLVGMFALIAVYKLAEWQYDRLREFGKLTVARYFRLRYTVMSIMYTALFGLYMCVGNAVYHFQPTVETEVTTLNSIIQDPSVSLDKKEMRQLKRQHYYDRVMMKWQAALGKDVDNMSKNSMILWGILCVILAIGSAPIACGLACQKQEALAVIVLLLGIGSLVAGIILFIKASKKGKLERQQKVKSS